MSKIRYIKQEDENDCGPICMAMICEYYGKKVSISKFREYGGTNKNGTNLLGLIKIGEKVGLDVEAFELEELNLLKENNFPCIAHIINNDGLEHYVVLERMTSELIVYMDPAKGRIKADIHEFKGYWTNIIMLINRNNSFNQISERPSVIPLFIDIIKNNKKYLLYILCASIIINLIGFIGTLYFKFLVDDIIPSKIINEVHKISLALILLYALQELIEFSRLHLILKLSVKIDLKVMLDYYKHILNLPMNFFETRKKGEIISRFNDVNKIREAISTIAITLMVDILLIIIGSILMAIQNLNLFLIVISFIPLYFFTAYYFRKKFEKYNYLEMEENAKLNTFMIESLQGISTIKSFDAQRIILNQTKIKLNNVIKYLLKLGEYSNVQVSINQFLTLITSVLILWYGSTLVLSNNIKLGELLSFNALVIYILGPIGRLVDVQPLIQSSIVAARRIVEVNDLEIEKNLDSGKNFNFTTDINIKNVSFNYNNSKKSIKNLNMLINKGQQIAIVGKSGSGKSTISKLLNSFYEVNEGEILIDNINIKDISKSKYREKVGYVSQENFFFSGSIIDNLLLGNKTNVNEEQLSRAIKLVGLVEDIEKLPLKYDTIIEENGVNFSGGQLQRLALARVILKDPDIFILDEITSSLDSISEKRIVDNISALKNLGKTIIIISHRLNVIENSDVIYCISEGENLEHGSHEDLMSKKGQYYELWRNQNF